MITLVALAGMMTEVQLVPMHVRNPKMELAGSWGKPSSKRPQKNVTNYHWGISRLPMWNYTQFGFSPG